MSWHNFPALLLSFLGSELHLKVGEWRIFFARVRENCMVIEPNVDHHPGKFPYSSVILTPGFKPNNNNPPSGTKGQNYFSLILYYFILLSHSLRSFPSLRSLVPFALLTRSLRSLISFPLFSILQGVT